MSANTWLAKNDFDEQASRYAATCPAAGAGAWIFVE
jgi:hypothetical protein